MKIVSIILILVGIVGLIFFGIQAMNNSESFSVLGLDVAFSSANWTPVIFSGVVLVAGILVGIAKKR